MFGKKVPKEPTRGGASNVVYLTKVAIDIHYPDPKAPSPGYPSRRCAEVKRSEGWFLSLGRLSAFRGRSMRESRYDCHRQSLRLKIRCALQHAPTMVSYHFPRTLVGDGALDVPFWMPVGACCRGQPSKPSVFLPGFCPDKNISTGEAGGCHLERYAVGGRKASLV